MEMCEEKPIGGAIRSVTETRQCVGVGVKELGTLSHRKNLWFLFPGPLHIILLFRFFICADILETKAKRNI